MALLVIIIVLSIYYARACLFMHYSTVRFVRYPWSYCIPIHPNAFIGYLGDSLLTSLYITQYHSLTTRVTNDALLNNILTWLLNCHCLNNLIMAGSDDATWWRWSLNWSFDTNNVLPPDISVALMRYKSSNALWSIEYH